MGRRLESKKALRQSWPWLVSLCCPHARRHANDQAADPVASAPAPVFAPVHRFTAVTEDAAALQTEKQILDGFMHDRREASGLFPLKLAPTSLS